MNQIIEQYIENWKQKNFQTQNHRRFPNLKDTNQIDIISDHIFGLKQNDIAIGIHHPAFNHGPKHKHDFFELIYIYHGSCSNHIYRQQDITIQMNQGDICLLNPNAVHCLDIGENTDSIVFNIMFKTSLFDKAFINLIPDNSIMVQFFINSLYNKKDKNEYLLFRNHPENDVSEIIEKILVEFIQKKICYQNTIQAYLIVLFSSLIRQFSEDEQTTEEKNFIPTDIAEILDYISQNYNTVTLTSAADHFFYNPSYLSSYIKRFTDRTFTDIVLEYKLEHCCNFLRNSNMPIADIVNLTGFNYSSHFFKLFQKHFHCTPAEYRKLYYQPNPSHEDNSL